MIKNEIKLTAKDGKLIHVHCWQPDHISENPIVVQIAHGMAEHGGMYHEFAEFLVKNNFIVYANDHRGHGVTVKKEDTYGYFADKDGWNLVLDDLNIVSNYILDKYPKVKLFLLGHSMGSFLARRFVQCYDVNLSGLILSGTGWKQGALGDLGIAIAKTQSKVKGDKSLSFLLNRFSFGNYNKKFTPTQTASDWLSRDDEKVKEYIKDQHCGFVFTAKGYYDMLGGIKELHKKEELIRTPKNLPIYIFSGDLDPVGKEGRGVKKVYNAYKYIGCNDVSLKLYPEGRHEMLNEINRYEVFEDVLNWINSKK